MDGGVYLPVLDQKIVDYKGHITGGHKEDAIFFAESFFDPVNDLDPEKKLVDLHMFDIHSQHSTFPNQYESLTSVDIKNPSLSLEDKMKIQMLKITLCHFSDSIYSLNCDNAIFSKCGRHFMQLVISPPFFIYSNEEVNVPPT